MDVSISLCHFGSDSFSLDSYSVDGTTFLIHQTPGRRGERTVEERRGQEGRKKRKEVKSVVDGVESGLVRRMECVSLSPSLIKIARFAVTRHAGCEAARLCEDGGR